MDASCDIGGSLYCILLYCWHPNEWMLVIVNVRVIMCYKEKYLIHCRPPFILYERNLYCTLKINDDGYPQNAFVRKTAYVNEAYMVGWMVQGVDH